ncbi:translation initiation factor IF-2-like [Schistocerca gregaria]|uniref:translation initiation factor IF-2-like n=1 Tax=Schistocerca gregaria TaxID=7010 RepID=UPI00211EF730|nr:translation initiation factor IF-2-like [Schistocerca gregaria]
MTGAELLSPTNHGNEKPRFRKPHHLEARHNPATAIARRPAAASPNPANPTLGPVAPAPTNIVTPTPAAPALVLQNSANAISASSAPAPHNTTPSAPVPSLQPPPNPEFPKPVSPIPALKSPTTSSLLPSVPVSQNPATTTVTPPAAEPSYSAITALLLCQEWGSHRGWGRPPAGSCSAATAIPPGALLPAAEEAVADPLVNWMAGGQRAAASDPCKNKPLCAGPAAEERRGEGCDASVPSAAGEPGASWIINGGGQPGSSWGNNGESNKMSRQYQRFLIYEGVSAIVNEASEGDESDPEDDTVVTYDSDTATEISALFENNQAEWEKESTTTNTYRLSFVEWVKGSR